LAKQILKNRKGYEPVFLYKAARSAAESVGKIPESLILEHLYNQIRTYFERNWLTAAPAARQEFRQKRRAGKNSWGH